MLHSIRRHAGTWASIGGALIGAGGLLVALGFAENSDAPNNPALSSNVWFNIGIGLAAAGLLMEVGVGLSLILEGHSQSAPGNEEIMRRILELLEVNNERTRQQLEYETKAPPEVIERAVRRLEAEAKISVHGDHIRRREIVYDETGRVAGEEILYESGRRDATVFPGTVQAKTDVPQTLKGAPLSVAPEFPKGAIEQGSRSGWQASCRPITGKPGHGALLLVDSTGERTSHFRCRVMRPDGSFVDSPPTAFDEHETPETRGAVRYPVHFGDEDPLAEGGYTFHWLGLVAGNRHELLLATGSFRVNALGQVYCSERATESTSHE